MRITSISGLLADEARAEASRAWLDGYRTSSPVMARPMIRRWISEVPSKMVKLSGVPGAEQRICCDHAAELAISL